MVRLSLSKTFSKSSPSQTQVSKPNVAVLHAPLKTRKNMEKMQVSLRGRNADKDFSLL